MNKIVQITPQFAVTGALAPADLAAAARMGFRAVLSNLPDDELPAAPRSAEERALAARAGLGFAHVPVRKGDMGLQAIGEEMRAALSVLNPPVLAHCASGQRSALAWAVAAARCHSVDRVLLALTSAGFFFAPLRAELEGLATLGSPGSPLPAALDLG
ncbi:MAG TPA: TIGR01244 family sulfur transferase [Hyphomicrobiaceae bacterium]|jgi:sulfide:quinone oxidoreductase|nr:TIGR01244 family sulfur transferase [Hyphomicrobiaceae bacterium]